MTPTDKIVRPAERPRLVSSGFVAPDLRSFNIGEQVDLWGLLRKLWRRRLVVLATMVVLVAVAGAVVFNMTPRYKATTLVMLENREKQVLSDIETVVSGLPVDLETIESEVLVIRSRKLAAQTIGALGLELKPEFNGSLRPPSLKARIKDVRSWMPSFLADALVGSAREVAAEPHPTAYGVDPAVIDAFQDRLTVEPQGRSRVISINFESEEPRLAASIVNTLADAYVVAQMEAKFEATRRANSWLSERLEVLRQQVEASENAVETFRQEAGVIREGENSTLTEQQISQLNMQLVVERTKRVEAEARLREVQKLLQSEGGIESATEVLGSTLIQQLRGQQAQVERTLASLSEQYGKRHPKMIAAVAESEEIRLRIENEVNKIVRGLENETSVARAREASIANTVEELKDEVGELKDAEVQIRSLEREAEANQALFAAFLTRSKETNSQETFQEPDANILALADVPANPSFPRKTLILALCLAASAFLGCLFAFIVELMDRGLRSTDHVEQYLGVTALGLIPSIKRRWGLGPAPEDYIVKHPSSAFAESIRSLHTTLLLSNSDDSPKVVLVASSLPKEGKTSVTLSLANFLAMAGLRVLVIDCDLRRPKLHKHFGVEASPGLVECLSGAASITDVIHEHPETGAHLVAAGDAPTNPSKLLTSPQMKKVIAGLSGYYEMIIIDSAPTLAVSDTRALCRVVDQAIFLVRWADTPREVATRGLRQILDSGVDLAGVLLSVVNTKRHSEYSFSDSSDFGKRVKKYYSD